MQVTSGAVRTLRFENVCDPEQPLKLYPRVMVVTVSSWDTVKAIGIPWAVIPLHCPTLRDGAETDGAVGPLHAIARVQANVTKHLAARVAGHAAATLRAIRSSSTRVDSRILGESGYSSGDRRRFRSQCRGDLAAAATISTRGC